MILMAAGFLSVLVGLSYWLWPAKRMSGFYGYTSYLATQDPTTHRYAQRLATQALWAIGTVEFALGALVHWRGLDRLFWLWLLVAVMGVVTVFANTESRLKKWLVRNNRLPKDYVEPDVALQAKSQRHHVVGLRDRLK